MSPRRFAPRVLALLPVGLFLFTLVLGWPLAAQQAAGVNVLEAMFDNETGGFTEAFDPNAEPGEIPAELLEAPAEGEAEA